MTRRSETLNEGVSTINSTFPRLLLHPAAAGGWLPSGDSVDTGAMHHLSSNVQLLCRESARHLVADVGPGRMPRDGGTYTGNGHDGGYTDGVAQTTDDIDDVIGRIAWDRRTARSYHLANLVADRELPEGGYGLRVIEVEIDCYVDSANSLELYCALTGTYNTPDQGVLACATYSAWTATGEQFRGVIDGSTSPAKIPTGRQTIRMWLITKTPAAQPHAQWRCRNTGSIASVSSLVYEGHLWVGWKSTDADNQILSINAWEVPEPFAPLIDTSVSSMLGFWLRADLCSFATNSGNPDLATYLGLIDQSNSGESMNPGLVKVDRSGPGGRPTLQFYIHQDYNGLLIEDYSSYAASAAVTVPTECTIFAVIRPKNTPSGGYIPVYEASYNVYPLSWPSLGGLGIRSQGSQYGAWAEDPTTGFCGSTLSVDRTYIVCAVISTTNVYWYVDGLLVSTVGRPAPGGTATQWFSGCAAGTGGMGSYIGDFDLSEVLRYDVVLSKDERAFVLEYLNRRYGVF